MATNASRKARGMRSQLVVTEWFRQNGWPWAISTGAGRSGVDIENMPGLAPEVKARRALDLTGFLRQAATNAGTDLPFVVLRPDGYGEAKVGQWAVIMTLADATRLLLEAGYSTEQQAQGRNHDPAEEQHGVHEGSGA